MREASGDAAPPVALPEGFAVWRLAPKAYDYKMSGTYGGTLYPVAPSPPMVVSAMTRAATRIPTGESRPRKATMMAVKP